MTQKEQIRQEIERRIGSVNEKQDANPAMPKYRWHMYEGMKEAFIDMKYFIDSLPEEKPSEDLEEAAMEIVIKMHPCLKYCVILGDRLTRGQLMALVKAGAEWQKEQMMKDAVEGEVENSCFGIVYLRKNLMNEGYSTGDKAKIIIVKEDDGLHQTKEG